MYQKNHKISKYDVNMHGENVIKNRKDQLVFLLQEE